MDVYDCLVGVCAISASHPESLNDAISGVRIISGSTFQLRAGESAYANALLERGLEKLVALPRAMLSEQPDADGLDLSSAKSVARDAAEFDRDGRVLGFEIASSAVLAPVEDWFSEQSQEAGGRRFGLLDAELEDLLRAGWAWDDQRPASLH